jgi:hypothetical protein
MTDNNKFNLTNTSNTRISLMKLIETIFGINAKNSVQYSAARHFKMLGMSDLEIIKHVILTMNNLEK